MKCSMLFVMLLGLMLVGQCFAKEPNAADYSLTAHVSAAAATHTPAFQAILSGAPDWSAVEMTVDGMTYIVSAEIDSPSVLPVGAEYPARFDKKHKHILVLGSHKGKLKDWSYIIIGTREVTR